MGYELTSKKKNKEVIQFNTKTIPFRDNTFDSVISIAVLHHICSKIQRINSIKELVRVTKQKGKILISVWGVHKNFQEGDNYIKWELQSKYNGTTEKVYQRYYYLYTKEELLNDITENISNVIVLNHYSNFNNRFIILEKI